jgi:8-oxo-dGTP pyrophosphatase MutT (NUDIX family)
MEKFSCTDKCCTWATVPYTPGNWSSNDGWTETTLRIKKAGGFIYDSSKGPGENTKILLIQSRGQLWGPPKGSMNHEETILECAKREVKEETGLELDESKISSSIIIKNKAMYYVIDTPETVVVPQTEMADNDANSIGWFKLSCLVKLIQENKIKINQHLRLLVKKILDVELP